MRKAPDKDTNAKLNRVSSCDLSPEAREKRLSSLALDVVEQQLLDGTVSSQVLTHFLKLTSRNYELEIEKLEEENKLLRAKTENINSQKRTEEFYQEVMKSMKRYRGETDDDPYIQ